MKKNFAKVTLLTAFTFAAMTSKVEALPMFSTQTGLKCTACHMQSMPKLNKDGRQFMLSGMITQSKTEDANSSSLDINPSMLLKLKYEKTWDKPTKSGRVQDIEDGTNEGRWSIPRSAALYAGGGVTENIGGLLNLSYRDEHDEASISGKAVYAKEIEGGYIGATLYSFSDFGPFSGMEVYNTGLYKPIRSFEMRKLTNATQACDVGTGEATGAQVYFDRDAVIAEEDNLFVTVGMYAPGQDNLYFDLSSNLLPFARVAYAYPIGDYNLILGAFGIVGGSTTSDSGSLSIKRETYGIDFQLEGKILEKSVSIIATNIFKNKVDISGIGAGSKDELESINNDAFSIEGEVMATPELGLKLSYLRFNDLVDYENRKYINVKDIDRAVTIGTDYTFIAFVPMKIAVEYSIAKPALERVADYKNLLVTLTLPF